MCPPRITNASPRAPHACTACRLSKVRCDKGNSIERCSRCARLGLLCQLTGVSKRGAKNVSRDIARLGPAVRGLLQTDNPDASSSAGPLPKSLEAASYQFDSSPLSWSGPRCPGMIMACIEGGGGRMTLLKHWLFIALRSRSCATLGNVLLLAHAGGLTLDNLLELVHNFDAAEASPELLAATPSFIAELQHGTHAVFTRSQVAASRSHIQQ